MNYNDQQLVTTTQNWLKTIIIEHNICPFAKRELNRGSIHFVANHDTDVETTLVIYDNAFISFNDYLDFLELAEALLLEQDYEGIYQLASFHPDYCFEGAKQDDPANYTNRSPYPMLHLLRESSIELALASYPHPENIPQKNIKSLRELGLTKIQSLLAGCYPLKMI